MLCDYVRWPKQKPLDEPYVCVQLLGGSTGNCAALDAAVPGEHSSGETKRLGGIAKTGNTHARRVLVEVCWHYRHRAGVGACLHARREGQPAWSIATADEAQQALAKRDQRMLGRGKPIQKIVVAIARELVDLLWAVMHEGEQPKQAVTLAV